MSPYSATFQSPFPPIRPPRESWYTFLLKEDTFDADMPFGYDVLTGEKLTRGALKQQSLAIAHKLRNADRKGIRPILCGSTVLVFSPNTLLYPVVIFALVSSYRHPMAGMRCIDLRVAHPFCY